MNIKENKVNTPPKNNNNNYLSKPKSLSKKNESINKLNTRSRIYPKNFKNFEIKGFPNSLNEKESKDFYNNKGNEIYDNEVIASKSKCINDTKKNYNLNIIKEQNETNILTDPNKIEQNQLNKYGVLLFSDKKDEIGENKKNNIMINKELISKKDNLKMNNDINKQNKSPRPRVDEEDYANINSKGEENKYKKITIRKDNQIKLIYKKSK